MNIRKIDTANFSSNKSLIAKKILNMPKETKSTDIKPVKTYTQYIKEYGLSLKSKSNSTNNIKAI